MKINTVAFNYFLECQTKAFLYRDITKSFNNDYDDYLKEQRIQMLMKINPINVQKTIHVSNIRELITDEKESINSNASKQICIRLRMHLVFFKK